MTSWTHFLPFAAIKQSRPVISAAQGAEKKTPLNPNGGTWLSIIAWQCLSLLLKPAYPPAWQTMGTPVRWKLFLLFFSRSLFFSPLWPRKPSRSSQCGWSHTNSPLVTEMFRISSAWFLCMSSHLSAVVRTQLMMSFLCFFHTPSLSPVLLLLHLLSLLLFSFLIWS